MEIKSIEDQLGRLLSVFLKRHFNIEELIYAKVL